MSTTPVSEKTSHRLVIFSDLHCGSIYGLCPPDLELVSGNVIKLNPRQQWLWDAWRWGWDQVNKICPDGFDVIGNGDLIEGAKHHGTDEVISARDDDHIAAATILLDPIKDMARKVYITQGTECHTGSKEDVIARLLGAVESPYGPAWESLYLRFCNTPVFATHHLGTTKRPWLEGNGLSMEMTSTMANYAREGLVVPRVYIYAHRHVFSSVHTASGVGAVNGAWQFLTRYGRKVVPGSVCSPSITILDWSYGNEGDDPIVIPIRIKPMKPIYA